MPLTQTKPSVKTVFRPLSEVLGTMIKGVELEGIKYDGLKELAEILNKRFDKVTVTEDDIINYFQPRICELESELLYKLYGYS